MENRVVEQGQMETRETRESFTLVFCLIFLVIFVWVSATLVSRPSGIPGADDPVPASVVAED